MSYTSAKSIASDAADLYTTDLLATEEKAKRCLHQPFVVKILKYNLPELNWIIVGCTTSIMFGAMTPVSRYF